MTAWIENYGSSLALEMISFQKDDFGASLESAVEKVCEHIKNHTTPKSLRGTVELEHLEKLIFNRIGIRTRYVTDKGLAAILPFYVNKNHIFLKDWIRGNFTLSQQEKYLKEMSKKSGFVDDAHARVGGIYSEYANPVHMNFFELRKTFSLTYPEITAINLHELGHGYYACSFADRMESCNQVLAEVARAFKEDKPTKRQHILREIQKVNPSVTEEEIDKIVSGDSIVAGVNLFRAVVGNVRGQLANTKYDETSFEQLADNFASRFGYGRPLVSGLEKLYSENGSTEKSKSIALISHMLNVVMFSLYVALGVVSIVGGAFMGAVIFLGMGFLMTFLSGDGARDYTYDELRDRYQRIRNDAIAGLKTANLDKAEAQTIVDGIKFIDQQIALTWKHSPFTRVLSNFVFASNREAKKAIAEQRLMEDLSHNNLFLLSTQLRLSA